MAQATDRSLVSLLFTQGRHIEMLLWYLCYKICFQLENSTRTSANKWLFSDVLAIESRSVSLRNECLIKIARDSCQHIFKKRKERLVISSLTIANRPDTPSDKQVLSYIFGSCRRYPSINSFAKSDETVGTISNKKNIAREATIDHQQNCLL